MTFKEAFFIIAALAIFTEFQGASGKKWILFNSKLSNNTVSLSGNVLGNLHTVSQKQIFQSRIFT